MVTDPHSGVEVGQPHLDIVDHNLLFESRPTLVQIRLPLDTDWLDRMHVNTPRELSGLMPRQWTNKPSTELRPPASVFGLHGNESNILFLPPPLDIQSTSLLVYVPDPEQQHNRSEFIWNQAVSGKGAPLSQTTSRERNEWQKIRCWWRSGAVFKKYHYLSRDTSSSDLKQKNWVSPPGRGQGIQCPPPVAWGFIFLQT